jgi:lipopolysaccharide transport system permease protein
MKKNIYDFNQSITNQGSHQETIIDSKKSTSLEVKEIWNYRWMLMNLIKNNILLPYNETFLNIIWVILRPAIIVLVMVTIKNRSGASMGVDIPYVLFLFSGIIVWWLFSESVSGAAAGMQRYKSLLTKVYFPRLITVIVPVLSNLGNFLIQFCGLLFLIYYYETGIDYELFFLPLLYLNVIFLSFSLGFIFSILNLILKDFEKGLTYTLYVGFFVSPILYTIDIVPEDYRTLYLLINPIAPILENIRQVLNDEINVNFFLMFQSWSLTILLLFIGIKIFVSQHEKLIERL